ncbi:MAG: hypothetical protein V3S39_02135 [Thermodesulfobacteriota bacterium]
MRLILRGIVALAMMVAVVYVTSDTLTKMDPYKMEPLNKIGIVPALFFKAVLLDGAILIVGGVLLFILTSTRTR